MIALALAAAILNPLVHQDTIGKTICVAGWSKSVRPPSAYTHRIKLKLVPKGERLSGYELDHWIPISLGGATYDQRNLVLQPMAEARRKDRSEAKLHRAVCSGRVSLHDAQIQMEAWR